MATITLSRPANQEPGRRYGDRPVAGVSTIVHLGNDYGWGSGRQVYAAAAGRVSVVRWSASTWSDNRSGGYGNYFIIDHGNGFSTLYAHQPTTPMLVSLGQQVANRQRVGTMGSTGNASGDHLHFELRLNNRIIDPNPYLGGTSAAASSNESRIELTTATEASVQENIRLSREIHLMVSQIRAEAPGATEASVQESIRVSGENYAMILQLRTAPSDAIDPDKLAAALAAAGLEVTIDTAAIAAAVDASLSDNFAAIPGAVRSAIIK